NPDFDAKIREADAAGSPEEAAELFKGAQTILFEDLPAIPLWYSNVTAGYSENVDNVVFGWDSVPVFTDITKNSSPLIDLRSIWVLPAGCSTRLSMQVLKN